jgi:hypothetical protein
VRDREISSHVSARCDHYSSADRHADCDLEAADGLDWNAAVKSRDDYYVDPPDDVTPVELVNFRLFWRKFDAMTPEQRAAVERKLERHFNAKAEERRTSEK